MNLKSLFLAACTLVMVFPVSAGELMKKTVRYDLGGTTFESTIVFPDGPIATRPGVLMVPNWMGPTEASLKKAESVAGEGWVVMMVDMYGVDVRPSNGDEAGKAAGEVRADRGLMRARAAKALEVFRAEAGSIGLDRERISAIGFCFGGGTVLELGRSGAELDAIVSFHGDLLSPTLESEAGSTRAKVLVLHGADDPYVPQEDVSRFVTAMRATEVDWQLVQFANTVHSFTDPSAAAAGQAEYHPVSAKRAFEMMDDLFDEDWDE